MRRYSRSACTSTTREEDTRFSVAPATRRRRKKFVVYRALYGDYSLWVRPKAMFLETVVVDGKAAPIQIRGLSQHILLDARRCWEGEL